ncbi:hypothetical protein [Roseovarius sp.]|uniref:hypothetical protein n=1 Tax=Roseovarius sp. TaxID=1486281 RepID=UPI0035165003
MTQHRHPHQQRLGPQDSLLDQSPLDAAERSCLETIRHMLHSFAAPQSQAWMTAVRCADAGFAPATGPLIATQAMRYIDEVRKSRISVFHFNSAACPPCAAVLTEHERRLMLALHWARRGHPARARLELMLLCEGNEIAHAMARLTALSRALPAPADVAPGPAQTAALHPGAPQ